MAKALKIIWSPKSEKNYNSIIDQIEIQWSNKEVKGFNSKAMHLIEVIQIHHKIFPASKKANLRKCVITEQISLIYRVNKTNIELVDFIHNKSNHNF